MTSKRTYPKEFKLQAVALAKSGDKSVSEIERDLGITPGLLAKWKQRLKADGEQAFSGKGRLKEDDELIRRLQRENEKLRQEREVLKNSPAGRSIQPDEKLNLRMRRIREIPRRLITCIPNQDRPSTLVCLRPILRQTQ